MRVHRVAGGSSAPPLRLELELEADGEDWLVGVLVALVLVSNRGCKLSLTGTAKRSTIRGGGRERAQILSWISGGRIAN